MTEIDNTESNRAITPSQTGVLPQSPTPIAGPPTPIEVGYFVNIDNWYRDHVHEMNPFVLARHQSDLEGKLNLNAKQLFPLTEADQVAIKTAIKVIGEKLDEILPKVPASIDEHDRNVGNRVHDNWPVYLDQSTRVMHLHFCELIDAWKINPNRRFVNFVGVNENDEVEGVSAFVFDAEGDMNHFVDHYKLDDFVLERVSFLSDNPGGYSWYLKLTNKFDPREVNEFHRVYKQAISELASISEERRRAVNVDGGKIGFLTVDHFSDRELIVLNRITNTRTILGRGAKQ